MTLEALHHRMDSEYSHALDERTVLLRLRVKRGEITRCLLYYGDRVDPVNPIPMRATPMARAASDTLFDYFEVRLVPGYPRICYYFEISNGATRCFYAGDGFYERPPEDRTRYFQVPYILREEIVSLPEWFLHTVVYQIFPDSFATGKGEIIDRSRTTPVNGLDTFVKHGGTLRGITDNLTYLEELGVGCIYLTPVFAAASYHKYDTIDYRSVDPAFGDNEALRELVSRAHGRGIKVILDGVFNHCGSGFFAFQDILRNGASSRYRDWFYDLELPIRYENPPNYATFAYVKEMPKLNTANPEVVEFFCEVGAFWIREADIDGWRLDVANEVGHDFWRAFRRRTKAEKADIVLIGEVWEDAHAWLQGDQFDSVMNYPFANACRAFFCDGAGNASTFAETSGALLVRYKEPITRGQLNLLDSHDVPRFLSRCGEDLRKLKLAVLFQMTWVGVPSVFYGDERAISGSRESEYRNPMRWAPDASADALTDYYRRLIRIRTSQPALTSAAARTLIADGGAFVFERIDPVPTHAPGTFERLLVVINNEESARTVEVPVDERWHGATDLLSGRRLTAEKARISVACEPYSGLILAPVTGERDDLRRSAQDRDRK